MKILPTCRQVHAGVLYRHRAEVVVADYPKLRAAALEAECRRARISNWWFRLTHPVLMIRVWWRVWWMVNGR